VSIAAVKINPYVPLRIRALLLLAERPDKREVADATQAGGQRHPRTSTHTELCSRLASFQGLRCGARGFTPKPVDDTMGIVGWEWSRSSLLAWTAMFTALGSIAPNAGVAQENEPRVRSEPARPSRGEGEHGSAAATTAVGLVLESADPSFDTSALRRELGEQLERRVVPLWQLSGPADVVSVAVGKRAQHVSVIVRLADGRQLWWSNHVETPMGPDAVLSQLERAWRKVHYAAPSEVLDPWRVHPAREPSGRSFYALPAEILDPFEGEPTSGTQEPIIALGVGEPEVVDPWAAPRCREPPCVRPETAARLSPPRAP
jgi:hypothetical protein